MNRFKRSLLWAALVAIVLLTGFSIWGAFVGAEQAKAFFNSLPLAVYWWLFVLLLALGIVFFERLIRVPSSLLIHLGCIVVLIGAMWSSLGGHVLQKRLFGIDKIPRGQMYVPEKMQENRVFVADANDVRTLPFFVRLRAIHIDYYPGGTLAIRDKATGRVWRLTAEPNAALTLSKDLGRVVVERVYENFKVDVADGKVTTYDEPDGYNPAVEVRVCQPDGTTRLRRIFEQFPSKSQPDEPLDMSYMKVPSRFASDVDIVRDGAVVASKSIEVNHPLHYGGYYFYQHEFKDTGTSMYSVLTVASDSGLNAVYAGYAMLVLGLCWHFWRRRRPTA